MSARIKETPLHRRGYWEARPGDVVGRADVLFVDVRPDARALLGDFGHIHGATHVPADELLARGLVGVPTQTPVALVCDNGRTSARCAEALVKRFGYAEVYLLVGGMLRWVAEGRPVARKATFKVHRSAPVGYIIGLGGNLGDPPRTFVAALDLLAKTPGLSLLARSRLYRTAPVGPPQPEYTNAAARLSYTGSAEALLDTLQEIERAHGRDRAVEERWGPRTLDLDVLYSFDGPIDSPRLVVPHRELEGRAFALAPMLDVAPELSARYGACLEALGGPPPTLSWP